MQQLPESLTHLEELVRLKLGEIGRDVVGNSLIEILVIVMDPAQCAEHPMSLTQGSNTYPHLPTISTAD